MHPAAELQFFFVKAQEILTRGVLHGVVILKIGLKDNFARSLASSGASGNLSEQLKRALGRTKIGQP